MIETAIALLFAHMLADFVFQTDRMVAGKRRPHVFAGHAAIVVATTWIALGLPLAPWPLAVIAVSHAMIDWIKLRWGGDGFRPFALDQAGHVVVIAAVAAIWPGLWETGLWARHDLIDGLPALAFLPAAMTAGAGLVAAVWAGGHAVASIMRGLALPSDPGDSTSLPQGGRLIGQLERFIILILVLSGETVGIGLLIAAKSILRFGEIQNQSDRHVAEYVIIGTLASFGWALGAALATAWLLAHL